MTNEELQTQNSDTSPSTVKPKSYFFFLKNAKGEPSVSLTMVFWAFIFTSILYILNAFEAIGPIKLRPFDVAATGVYFSSVCALYFGRKFTDRGESK